MIFSSGSEPLAAGRIMAASYDVDSRVADPVSLFAVTPHAQPSADGEKSQTAGDAALASPRNSKKQAAPFTELPATSYFRLAATAANPFSAAASVFSISASE